MSKHHTRHNKHNKHKGGSKRSKKSGSCGCRSKRGGTSGLALVLKDLAVPAGLFYTQKMVQHRRGKGTRHNRKGKRRGSRKK